MNASPSSRPTASASFSWRDPRLGLALLFLLLVAISVFAVKNAPRLVWVGDGEVYYRAYQGVSAGKKPYLDFALEYPPLAAYGIVGVWAFTPNLTQTQFYTVYPIGIGAFLLGFVGVSVVLLRRLGATRSDILRSLSFFTLSLAISYQLVFARFDIQPAVWSALAVLCYLVYVQNGRLGFAVASGVALGLGFSLKLYPALFLYPLLALEWRRNRRRAVCAIGGAFALVALSNLPFFFLGGDGARQFWQYHAQRGVQSESLYATLILLGEKLGLLTVESAGRFGALEYDSAWSPLLAQCAAPFALLSVGAVTWLFHRALNQMPQSARSPEAELQWTARLVLGYVLLSAMAFILTNKVFSTQYILWILLLLPVCALLNAPRLERRIGAGMLALAAVTYLIYPKGYALLLNRSPLMLGLLSLRLGIMLWLAATLARNLWGRCASEE